MEHKINLYSWPVISDLTICTLTTTKSTVVFVMRKSHLLIVYIVFLLNLTISWICLSKKESCLYDLQILHGRHRFTLSVSSIFGQRKKPPPLHPLLCVHLLILTYVTWNYFRTDDTEFFTFGTFWTDSYPLLPTRDFFLIICTVTSIRVFRLTPKWSVSSSTYRSPSTRSVSLFMQVYFFVIFFHKTASCTDLTSHTCHTYVTRGP